MVKTITTSVEETQRFAQSLLRKYPSGVIIALTGSLASGKTTFVQGLGQALGIKRMLSPTFTILRQYILSTNDYELSTLYHLDLYRLNSAQEALDIGLEEILATPHAIVAIEWPEKITDLLAPGTLHIDLAINSDNSRTITYGTKD